MPILFLKNFAPRWIIFCCDILLISVSFTFSFFLNEHLSVNLRDIINFIPGLITNLLVSLICIGVFSIYKGIIRYSEVRDIIRIIKFSFLQFAIWILIRWDDSNLFVSGKITMPLLVINLFAVMFVLVAKLKK